MPVFNGNFPALGRENSDKFCFSTKIFQRKWDKSVDYGVFNMSDDFALRNYADMVYRVAVRNTRDIADAEDVFSDTFLAYFTKKPEFESEEHRKAWLIRVAINRSRNIYRAQKKIAELDENIPAAERDFDQMELSVDLNDALRRMSPDYREVICLYYLQEMSVHEIAQILDKNESTIRTQLFRARKQLRGLLE